MDWQLIGSVLGPIVILIACVMELFKKRIRKSKSLKIENQLVAAFFSVGLTIIGYLAFDLPGNPIAIAYYSIGVYILQCYVDMRIVKTIVRIWMKRKGVELDESSLAE
jgi:hypothetical protein